LVEFVVAYCFDSDALGELLALLVGVEDIVIIVVFGDVLLADWWGFWKFPDEC
jgi:hypothetical protein